VHLLLVWDVKSKRGAESSDGGKDSRFTGGWWEWRSSGHGTIRWGKACMTRARMGW
jgi:hypothetical protein